MASSAAKERVRELREQGRSPKQIARALGMSPAAVAPLVREVAAESGRKPTAALAGCWVSPDWAIGLRVPGRPAWPGLPTPAETGTSGMVTVAVAREHGGSKVSACTYLVDTYCLGVKNAMGPQAMDRRKLPAFLGQAFRSYSDPPLEAPLGLAQQLVFRAIEYAHGLGFGPHPDFFACALHLGNWEGPGAIGFGRDGKPLFVPGPYDDAAHIIQTLEDTVGLGGFDFLLTA